MVANATDMSLSLALMTGPTAAMALPPQIAVPELIRYEVSRFIFNNFRPMSIPITMVPTTETIVNIIPSLPDASEA